MNRFWNWKNIVNEDGSEVERVLELRGAIAEDSWFEDNVTPEMFRQELHSGTGPVSVWINSPGGDCIAASQIYTMLMDYPYDVTVKIDGIAASAASVIAMAGTTVLMAPTSLMMIHDPMTMAWGNKEEIQKSIKMLDEVKESIMNAYEIKTGLDRDKISKLMSGETWMNANKAQELGFIDGILEDEKRCKDSTAFDFNRKAVENVLLNKISAKCAKNAHTTEELCEEITETQGNSVKVSDLLARLSAKLI